MFTLGVWRRANLHGSSSNVKLYSTWQILFALAVSGYRLYLNVLPIIAQEVALNTRLPGFREKARITLLELEHQIIKL